MRAGRNRSRLAGHIEALVVAAIHLAQPLHELAELEPVARLELIGSRLEFVPARISRRVAERKDGNVARLLGRQTQRACGERRLDALDVIAKLAVRPP